MKVLHVNSFDTGGAGKACLRLHKALLQYEVDSNVLLKNKSNDELPGVEEIWQRLSTIEKVKKLTQEHLFHKNSTHQKKILQSRELFSSYRSIWDITQSELYKNADIIHLHWVAGFVDLPSFFNTCDKRIVWTTHDFFPFLNGLHYPIADEKIFAKEQEENKNLLNLAIQKNRPFVVSPSSFLLKEMKKNPEFEHMQTRQIFNCSNTEHFWYRPKMEMKKELGYPGNKKLVLFIADNIDYPRKGFALFKEALGLMNDHDLIPVLVGQTEQEKVRLPIQPIINGVVRNEEQLSKIYAASDLLVLPSLIDNSPNTISEALSCGTPVVSFDTGGIPEMLTSENAVLAKTINAASLAKAIDDALSKKWNHEDIASKAHVMFNETHCAGSYLEVYKYILNNGN